MLWITIFAFIIILALLVLVHEAGHFFTARFFGIRADEFGFGFPPRMFGAQKLKNGKWKFVGARGEADPEGGTLYSLNWLPLGGFVKIKGESGEGAKEKDSFASRPIWQRGIVLSAGVIMNVVLAYVLLVFALTIGVPQSVEEGQPIDGKIISGERTQVLDVQKDYPAYGILRAGDILISVDGTPIDSISQFQAYLSGHREGVVLSYKRGETISDVPLVPKVTDDQQRAVIGVQLSQIATVSYSWNQAIVQGLLSTGTLIVTILQGYYDFFQGLFAGKPIAADVSGPVGIAVYTGMVVKLGFIYVLQFAIILSLNLAILNFIPFPALDGGRFLFLMIEKFRRRAVAQKVEAVTHTVGFALLMVLVVFLTFRDIARWGGDILRVIKSSVGL